MHESLVRAHQWAVDRNITANYIDQVLKSIDGFIRELVALEVIVNGSVWVDPDLNTPAVLASGTIYFDFDFTPYPPAEHIIFRSHITNDFLVEILPPAVAA